MFFCNKNIGLNNFMFSKEESQSIKEAETIIGPTVKVKGDFHGQGNIVVEGEVEGSLKSRNKLQVKDKAKVIADVEAKDAIIGGTVQGNITVEGYLELTKTAVVNGDIVASSLSIARGAVFNGRCTMTGRKEKSASGHSKNEEQT